MSELLEAEDELNKNENFLNRVSIRDTELLHEEMDSVMPVLYQATQTLIHLVSKLAEVNRKKKALEAEKSDIKTGDDFKTKTTGAAMSIKAENINVATVDGDGNLHTNMEAGISVRTPGLGISMKDDKIQSDYELKNFNDGGTGICTIRTENKDADSWYSLDGRRLSGPPSLRGGYIKNRKKIIVR